MKRTATAHKSVAPQTGLVDTLLALVCALRALQLSDRDHPWLALPLTMAQLKALMLIFQSGGMQSRGLADRLGIGPSAVTPLVDRLVEQKLVRRDDDPNDRRIIWVRPTAKAVALGEKLMEANRSALAEVLEALPPRDHDRVHESLHLLLDGAERVLNRHQQRTRTRHEHR